ncbi:hypothetical protein BH11BAC3_BH11BAC3_02360 [soil metagenome]
MRKISRANVVKPVELDSNDCQTHLNRIIASSAQVKTSTDFYKGKRINADGTTTFTVRESLKTLYKNKCAYCEKLSHAPKIDHHRPKGAVVGAGNLNNGYYWLCYEWTNLLPCCTDCNSIEAKGSKYPLKGNRNNSHPITGNPVTIFFAEFLYDSRFNIGEQPLLLHPEYSTPENDFAFDKQGRIVGITQEGRQTITALKLDNPDLNGWRRKIYKDHLAELERIVRKYHRNINPITEDQFEDFISDWLLELVLVANDDTLEYTLFRKFILENINFFFLAELNIAFQPITKAKIDIAFDILSN